MKKSLFVISACLILAACASRPEAADYAGYDCGSLKALVEAQDVALSYRAIDVFNDRGLEEIRHESDSPWAGRPRSQEDREIQFERQAITQAYRRKGCKD